MEITRGGAIEKPDSCKSYVPIDTYDLIECKHPEVIKFLNKRGDFIFWLNNEMLQLLFNKRFTLYWLLSMI